MTGKRDRKGEGMDDEGEGKKKWIDRDDGNRFYTVKDRKRVTERRK